MAIARSGEEAYLILRLFPQRKEKSVALIFYPDMA